MTNLTTFDWIGQCACGWETPPLPSDEAAWYMLCAHRDGMDGAGCEVTVEEDGVELQAAIFPEHMREAT